MRILLVEDDPMIGDAIQAALSDDSYAVDWVKDGLMALAAVDTQHYDLMLLDKICCPWLRQKTSTSASKANGTSAC
jgi:DNA-binding response OmpR family regulator